MTQFINRLLNNWRASSEVGANIIEWITNPATDARLEPFPSDLHPGLAEGLRISGIHQLYLHQAQTWRFTQEGKNVVVVTATASGKTLCYNLPVLQRLLLHKDARAIYLFPTKALAQDQLSALQKLLGTLPSDELITSIPVAIYDGDTPASSRSSIRQKARIVLSNPDMLHTGILPHHTSWAEFFRNLNFVIIDEMHVYRGVFGSHLANVIRRLKRIAMHYGSSPQFILTTATIANPQELAARLIEPDNQDNLLVVDQDGSPHGRKHFLLYNPPIVNQELGIRRSALQESQRLAEDLLNYDIQTILFARSRRSVEILLTYLRQSIQSTHDSLSPTQIDKAIRGYRSGYMPRQRREIEQGLRQGKVRCVVATNALELGIDIGGMGAAVLVGYPGSIASTQQQAGRAGRDESTSLAILVASADPLDQYLVAHPDYFLARSPERALVNPDNLLILLGHIRCAAFELPFKKGEKFGNLEYIKLQEYLDFLIGEGVLHESHDRYYWMADQYPARNISLRSTGTSTITLQVDHSKDIDGPNVIGEIDQASAVWMVHPQAVYLHESQTYLVDQLDLEMSIAHLTQIDTDYYTQDISETSVQLVHLVDQSEVLGTVKNHGEIKVTRQVVGYQKIQWYTQEVLGVNPLDLPPIDLFTTGYWLTLLEPTVDALREMGLWSNDPNQYGPTWPVQRDHARERDGYRCQVCGASEQGRAHDVHHKIPFRTFTSHIQANVLENLVTLCPACHRRAEASVRVRSGLAGLGFILDRLAPLFLMCDQADLGVHSDPQSPLSEGRPTVVIYDQAPAGLGFSQALYEMHNALLEHALDLVMHCPCTDGCPSCVGPGGENGLGSKQETIAILELLIGENP